MNLQKWLTRREYGFPSQKGEADFVMTRIYNSMDLFSAWNVENCTDTTGGIFNLEFSPIGNVLVAACEKKSILIFDTVTTDTVHTIPGAHTDNVNCVRFLDDRMFATCSDDTTVALWDLRYMKSKVRSLHGHSNWVKNIEYSRKDNLLVTSGFDGCIFTWDINSHTEQGLIYQRVFHTSGLMRCCISPDGTKLVICTTGGYLMIIHDLNLSTLHRDLSGFRPSIFRLMQMGHQYIPQAAKFDHVFSKKQTKNRVELVTDFPENNDAEVILALQIHPHGHSFLSRNISVDESTEWSCVHDINEEPGDITETMKEPKTTHKRKRHSDGFDDLDDSASEDSSDDLPRVARVSRLTRRRSRLSAPSSQASSQSHARNTTNASTVHTAARAEAFVPDIWAAEVTVQDRAIRQNRARTSNSVTGYNFVYAISSGVMPASMANSSSRDMNDDVVDVVSNSPNPEPNNVSTDRSDELPSSVSMRRRLNVILNQNRRRIFQNPKKLTYYIQESNNGKGFIKEPCFSSDGRIICSPYRCGVRLLSYDETCIEYPQNSLFQSGERPVKKLVELKTLRNVHHNIVLCSKFSPREPLLVTGCRSGKIIWHHPIL